MAFASQVTDSTYDIESYKLLNKIIKYLRATKDICLRFPKLDMDTLQITTYSDTLFNNNTDNKSQLRYVILLSDSSGRCCLLHYSSHNSRRITRSGMAGETIALAEAFDHFFVTHELQRILGRPVPLLMMTDSKLLFDFIPGNKYTTEARWMVDISAVREAYNQRLSFRILRLTRKSTPSPMY